jgi:hypothetical protein
MICGGSSFWSANASSAALRNQSATGTFTWLAAAETSANSSFVNRVDAVTGRRIFVWYSTGAFVILPRS